MPKAKQLLLLISKTSGSQDDVLPDLEEVLSNTTVTYDCIRVATPPELAKILKKNVDQYQAVAVYGGDGSIIAAAKTLAGTNTKLIILPGGTANIIAKGYDIPSSAAEALNLYVSGQYRNARFDIASANEKLFAFDMHSGWWADSIGSTPRKLKKRFGQLAYGLSALRQAPKHETLPHEIIVDGRRRMFKAHTLMIANHGFQNLFNVPLFKQRHRYGVMQVAIIKSLNPLKLTVWFFGKILLQRNIGGAIKTYTGASLIIKQSPKDYIFDDDQQTFRLPITIKSAQEEVVLAVPPKKVSSSLIGRFVLRTKLIYLRMLERLRNVRSGTPRYEYSRIAPRVYLGGAYRQNAYKRFNEWGVTGVVNMRSSEPLPAPKGFTILQLKTADWHAPPLELLKEGVDFIEKHVSDGGGAYVHCRQGEGRGPTMAAAYLISKGLSVEEALTHIERCRPVSHPNRSQVKRLAEWQDYLAKNT